MEKGNHHVNETKSAKVVGAMKHLLLELQKVNIINDIDREHLIREYVIGRISSFGHLAEYLLATTNLGRHNYDQIIQYGRRYGETR
jgi:hypothetical protein